MEALQQLKSMNVRELISQIVNLAFVVCAALVIWKGLSVYTNCESPIVVVLTGSMEPGFYRGDILFLSLNTEKPIRTGDIVVYKLNNRDIPIVHRVTRNHENTKDDVFVLTKGDNNARDDRYGIYNEDMEWLRKEHIIGQVKGILPHVGMVTIVMNDYPWVKFAVIGILGILVITQKE